VLESEEERLEVSIAEKRRRQGRRIVFVVSASDDLSNPNERRKVTHSSSSSVTLKIEVFLVGPTTIQSRVSCGGRRGADGSDENGEGEESWSNHLVEEGRWKGGRRKRGR